MNNSDLKSYLDDNNIPYEVNVNLKKKTWIHRGGVAGLYITPFNSEQLERLVIFLYINSIKFLVFGHTSNVYILNSCNLPVVISTVRCRKFILEDNKVFCETGVSVIHLSKNMVQQGRQGFEYLTGLPGTIGGALVNNSSCKTNSISDLLISARIVTSDGEIKIFTKEDFEYEFRNSIFKKNGINGTIISAILKTTAGNSEVLQKTAIASETERKMILEGFSQNLGCTVNRCFINGKMHLLLRITLYILSVILRGAFCSNMRKNEIQKNVLCFITGYKRVAKYVSSKNPIVFIWLDDGADAAFPIYIEFMRKVYKTDNIEIEIIR